MSEPMSSGEIEDVLSSIRRLVSEDLRPVSKGAAPVAVAEADKLILTPALRIVPDARVRDRAEPVLREEEDAPPAGQPVPEPEEFLPEQDWKASGQEWLPESEPVVTQDACAPDTGEAGQESQEQPQDDHENPESGPELTGVVNSIGSAVNDDSGEWEAETGDTGFADMAWKAPEWAEEAEIVTEPEPVEDEQARNDRAEAEAVAEILRDDAAKASQAEAAAAQPEPDADDRPDDETFADSEGYFDETVLRDLVRDLIREELNGALGERITRNVRKLVRAEINRALTARDFD